MTLPQEIDLKDMPPLAPLPMPRQNLWAPMRDPAAPGWNSPPDLVWRRLAIFAPAILVTVLLVAIFGNWFSDNGLQQVEYVLIFLVGLSFFWISLGVSTATLGLMRYWYEFGRNPRKPADSDILPLNIAILLPVYNEPVAEVFGNAEAMLADLMDHGGPHHFSLHILSDTKDADAARQEEAALHHLRRVVPGWPIWYRRRSENTDRKSGNLADWIEGWGGAYEAFLILDADSLMTASAVNELADVMAADPSAGLVQSYPRVFRAKSFFARAQQFSNVTYGWLLAEGLAYWSDRECNFWGHNALIRTKAMAACAGLPRLKRLWGGENLIMSHDFVEAALLRRAGWAVRFFPRIEGSWEETPTNLIDYIIRDRRWCQGNMQHLRVMFAAGLHPASRLHMLHGAFSYLLSPVWLSLLTIWALFGLGEEASVISYFTSGNPLMPDWPTFSSVNGLLILLFMYAMLLVPKLMAVGLMLFSGETRATYGGATRFLGSVLCELVISIIYAPILMIQQSKAILMTFAGVRDPWKPQQRSSVSYPMGALFKFHFIETLVGLVLTSGIVAGVVSLWLLPVAFSLVFAVPLSGISGLPFRRGLLDVPTEWEEPNLKVKSDRHRLEIIPRLKKAELSDPFVH